MLDMEELNQELTRITEATPVQRQYLYILSADHQAIQREHLTKQQASQWISVMKNLPRNKKKKDSNPL